MPIMRWCLEAGLNLETGQLSRQYIAEISLNVMLPKTNETKKSFAHCSWVFFYFRNRCWKNVRKYTKFTEFLTGVVVTRNIKNIFDTQRLFLNVCPFAVAGSRKVGPVNKVNHTSCVAVVTPTDRPKSVCNRCVIELFRRCLCCHFALLTFLLV